MEKSIGGLPDQLNSLALIPSHRIIVGVDYGTTFTGISPHSFFWETTKYKANPAGRKGPAMLALRVALV
jgi:hypothetical protein